LFDILSTLIPTPPGMYFTSISAFDIAGQDLRIDIVGYKSFDFKVYIAIHKENIDLGSSNAASI